MARVMVLNKGRKRKLRAIHWSVPEKVSAAALFLLIGGFCIAVALWMANEYPIDPQEPHLVVQR
jgi:hypothetical protein